MPDARRHELVRSPTAHGRVESTWDVRPTCSESYEFCPRGIRPSWTRKFGAICQERAGRPVPPFGGDTPSVPIQKIEFKFSGDSSQ
jgi:hypothetical protein